MAQVLTPELNETDYQCDCGRIWRFLHGSSAMKFGSVIVCRCAKHIAKDPDGSWCAELQSPLENWATLRRPAVFVAILISQIEIAMRLPIWRWFKLQKLAVLNKPNIALRVRWEMASNTIAVVAMTNSPSRSASISTKRLPISSIHREGLAWDQWKQHVVLGSPLPGARLRQVEQLVQR